MLIMTIVLVVYLSVTKNISVTLLHIFFKTFFPPSNNRKEVESSLCGKYISSFDLAVYNLFHFTRDRYLQLNHKKRRLPHTSTPLRLSVNFESPTGYIQE